MRLLDICLTRRPRLPGWWLFLTLSLLFGCEPSGQQAQVDVSQARHGSEQQQAESVLTEFLDASVARDFGRRYDLLSAKDRASKSRDSYIAEQTPSKPTLADAFYKNIAYHIEQLELNGDQAKAMVEYRYPDVERMIKKQFGLSILSDFTDQETLELKHKLEAAYQDQPMPMRSSRKAYTLLREQGQWRVYLGWDVAAPKS